MDSYHQFYTSTRKFAITIIKSLNSIPPNFETNTQPYKKNTRQTQRNSQQNDSHEKKTPKIKFSPKPGDSSAFLFSRFLTRRDFNLTFHSTLLPKRRVTS